MSSAWIGVDGGGTKVSVCAVDEEGTVLARSLGPSTNQNSVGWEAAEEALASTLREVLSALGGRVVRGACLGLSGVDREPERVRWTALAASLLGEQCAVQVANDAVVALASGTGGLLQGAVVISGTGTIALAVGADGRRVRSQGWGPLLGDRGAGYDIGLAALQAVMRSYDELSPPTALSAPLLRHCGCNSPQDLVQWAYGAQHAGDWQRVAALAPLVEQAAVQGDGAALGAVAAAVQALLAAVQAVVRRAVLQPRWTLVLAGGTLCRPPGSPPSLYAAQLTAAVQALYGDQVQVVQPSVGSDQAAALIALRCKDPQ